MTSLNNLLNPESTYEYNRRVTQAHSNGSPASTTSSPPATISTERTVEENYYGQTNISITPHEPHPNCPDTLTCLPDTDGRPQHTLPVILRCAILGSPKRRLTIREIYAAMEKKYPYYKTAGPAWKQSVRHHLSLNRLFERQPRPATDPGFGSYWTVNLDAPPGTKRPRKRGRANKDAPANNLPLETDALQAPLGHSAQTLPHPIPPLTQLRPPLSHQHRPQPRRFRSRSFNQGSTLRSAKYYDEDEDEDDMEWEEEGTRMSDYDSAEDTPYQYDPRQKPSTSSSHPPHSLSSLYRGGDGQAYKSPEGQTFRSSEAGDPLIERLKMEMAGLRRQSTDAVNASLRLSAQLSESQADTSRARSTVKVLENRLEEEIRRRRDAEHIAEDEARLRLAAEDALRAYQLQRRPPGYTSSRP
ncbi:uncharacterized protein C8Q71DRAFT_796630 [Rhodofomes roseus]|uniref:Fork-head domain-containing protein n=1 Tax=Rhodofomes roseus TaxID=34475 RepID=A0ABQ8KHG6_9APHY|nr:uncharacterized protein C8Q71DRAFT_796630 [Rhodofomes roseus]KAH9837247.1 hypothetical protein C8Q71DRAFT_796630 [Rhodofomes roseus]